MRRNPCPLNRLAGSVGRDFLWLPLEGKLRPQAVMRCRLRAAKPFIDEKLLIPCDALTRYTSSGGCATTFPSGGRLTVGFRFSDREFPTASSPTRFSFSEKEKLKKERPLRGLRREVRFILSSLSRDENMNSMRLRPPRPPKERVRPVAAATEMGVHSGKRFGIRGKNRSSAIRAARFRRAELKSSPQPQSERRGEL